MAFGFDSSLGSRLRGMSGFPPNANYAPPIPDSQSAEKAQAGATPPSNPAGPATVPAGASSGPGYIPGIYSGMPGTVAANAAPAAATAVGDAAGGAGGAAAAGGPDVLKFLLSMFGA